MTLSPEILAAVKAACAAHKTKPVTESTTQMYLGMAQYFKWLVDAPANESADIAEALSNPDVMREAVKTRESTALILTLASAGKPVAEGLVIEAAIEAKAFGFKGTFQQIKEAVQAIQQVPTRFGYMVLSAMEDNQSLKKNFLDLSINEDGTTLFYFTKPVAADKLKTEAERVLAPFGVVECLVSPGDQIGEGVTSDLFVFAVTPTQDQMESIMPVLIDGLVEAAIADTFQDISNEKLVGLMSEAIQFMNQTPPNGDEIGAEAGEESGEESDDKDSDEEDKESDEEGEDESDDDKKSDDQSTNTAK